LEPLSPLLVASVFTPPSVELIPLHSFRR